MEILMHAWACNIYTLSLIHTSEPTREAEKSYAASCSKKKKKKKKINNRYKNNKNAALKFTTYILGLACEVSRARGNTCGTYVCASSLRGWARPCKARQGMSLHIKHNNNNLYINIYICSLPQTYII